MTKINKKIAEQKEIDPVEEIHKYRDEHAKKFNYNLDAMFQDLKDQEKKLKIKTVRLAPKRTLKRTGTLSFKN